eukprot:GILK01005454.1.p1 GENE.GILK01005454.1~~GILK01005454.1.p1  ORF type:complete len:348 (+),score=50.37 GILK01005454.1:29-1045(+)
MKAAVVEKLGSVEIKQGVPVPPLKNGQARVRVHYCGLNFADALMVAGQYQVKPKLPFIAGSEIAGEVVELGEGVTNLRVGDRVFGMTSGGLAEQAVAHASTLMPIPASLDYAQAASFPIVYGTSHLALVHRANLKEGQTLLVLGAGGGVGAAAVQIGKALGATVIAAASSDEKLAIAKRMGADHLINYSTENIRDKVKEFCGTHAAVDVLYDPVGGALFEDAFRTLKWGACLLVIGFASGTIPKLATNLCLVKNLTVHGIFWGSYFQNDPQTVMMSLGDLSAMLERKQITPFPSQVYPLSQAAEALDSLVKRRAKGKVVVQCAESTTDSPSRHIQSKL